MVRPRGEAGEGAPPSWLKAPTNLCSFNGNQSWPEWGGGGGITGNTPIRLTLHNSPTIHLEIFTRGILSLWQTLNTGCFTVSLYDFTSCPLKCQLWQFFVKLLGIIWLGFRVWSDVSIILVLRIMCQLKVTIIISLFPSVAPFIVTNTSQDA